MAKVDNIKARGVGMSTPPVAQVLFVLRDTRMRARFGADIQARSIRVKKFGANQVEYGKW
jgi:hypothetical protein